MARDVIKFALIILLVVVPVRLFIAQPFIVNGASMDPTFSNGQYLIVDQISYRFQDPQRGDVVVFKYPNDPNQFFIKRIVGLPGERVRIVNSSVVIYNEEFPSGMTLNEPYVEVYRDEEIDTELSSGEYYVLGDNRKASSDSRTWGALDSDFIVGRPFLRLLPPQRVNIFPGIHKNY